MSSAARLLSALKRLAGRLPVRLAYFALLALAAKWPALSNAGSLNDFRDAHILTQYEDSARRAVVGFHQLPLWDPYYCGGIYELGTPQSHYVSPSFGLTLLFGTLRADALIAFAMIVIGLEGTFRYAVDRKASNLGATLAAPIFALSGLFAVAPSLGWTHFYGFELIPWVALGARRAFASKVSGAVLAAFALAWMIGFGGTYAAPLVFLFCILEWAEAMIAGRIPRERILAMSALTAALAIGLSAIRLWPIVDTLMASPRLLGGRPGHSTWSLWKMLVATNGPAAYFVGFLAIPLAALGMIQKRALPLLVACAIFFWLATGYHPKLSLFAQLRELPLYRMLRYPERFLTLMALPVATLAAIGFTALEARPRWHASIRFVGVGLLIANAGLLVRNSHAYTADRAPPPVEITREFHQARGNRWAVAHYGPMGRGSLSCFDDYEVPQSPLLRGDLSAEEYVKSAGAVTRRSWSPNRIELAVEAPEATRVYVNQNWHSGWRSNVGEVRNERGLLVIDVPRGRHDLVLTFLPRSAVGGACVSLVAAVAAILIWRRKRATVITAILAACPFAIGALVLACVREPPSIPRPLETPDGRSMVVTPPFTGTLDTVFAGGVTLVAARAAPQDEKVHLELDWKTNGDVPSGMGVFVHIVSPTGKEINFDHVLLSQAVTLEDAPAGVILRDVADIELPSERGRFTVQVGLWMARRSGERVRVVSRGSAEVTEEQVLAATFDMR